MQEQEVDDDPGGIPVGIKPDVHGVAAVADPARDPDEVRLGRQRPLGPEVVVGDHRVGDLLVESLGGDRVVLDVMRSVAQRLGLK